MLPVTFLVSEPTTKTLFWLWTLVNLVIVHKMCYFFIVIFALNGFSGQNSCKIFFNFMHLIFPHLNGTFDLILMVAELSGRKYRENIIHPV